MATKSFDLRQNPEDKERAYDNLVAFLRVPEGKTQQEIADKFGISYWTARIHVSKLIDTRRIEKVPGFGKAQYFRAVDYAGMPEILGHKLWNIVVAHADAKTPFAFTTASREFLIHLAQLFYFAGLQFDGGTVTRKQLNELEQAFIKDLSRAEKLVEATRTILNHKELFRSPEDLKKALLSDPDVEIDSAAISQAWSIHKARFESHHKDI